MAATLPVCRLPPFSSSEPTKIQLTSFTSLPIPKIRRKPQRPLPLLSAYLARNRFNDEEDERTYSFEGAVLLFNRREYYKCHDALEALWNESEEPTRTLVHGILQCAVSFYHLFNQNHRGAMMELGEGLCKLRKMNFENGPFHQFEKEISQVLEFIYQTQLEHAACTGERCVAMDQTEGSYQLLGEYGAGERLYHLEIDRNWNAYIVFCPDKFNDTECEPPCVKIPLLSASEQDFFAVADM